jgi:cysteine desulfurase/selenocysteine lyase
MRKFDIDKIRTDFPVLGREMKGHPLVYFDNGAMALTPEPVIRTMEEYYRKMSCNIHRGIYELSEQATELFEESRKKAARFLNASEEEIIFTHGATEGVNLIARTWGEENIRPGEEILITGMEHHANIVPWQQLSRRREAILKHLPVDPERGTLEIEKLDSLLGPNTRIAAVTGMSNVTGTATPLDLIIEKAHAAGAKVLVDAAQLSVHQRIDVKKLDADFLVFSGHKVYGPTGIGVLYGKKELLEQMPPFLSGGDMIREVKLTDTEFRESPYRFEAGTPHVAGALGLRAALDYVEEIGFSTIIEAERKLMEYALRRAREKPLLKVYGPLDTEIQGSVFSFNLQNIHPHDVGTVLNEHGIAVRAGYHCAQPYVEAMGCGGTVRASMAFYNTTEEIDRLFAAIEAAEELFRDFM